MKKAILTLVLVLSIYQSKACGDSTCSCGFWSTGFGGPIFSFSTIASKPAVFIGGMGGHTFGKHFSFGGGGYGHIAPKTITDENFGTEPVELDMGYGGFMLDFHTDGQKMVAAHLNTLLGMGGYEVAGIGDGFLLIEPTARVSVKLASFLRIGGGLGYRWTNTFSSRGLAEKDLSGLSGGINVFFGYFGKPVKF